MAPAAAQEAPPCPTRGSLKLRLRSAPQRTFATCCLCNGMNSYDLKTLMGYSGLEMLLRYVDNDAQMARARYGPVDRMPTRI